MELATRPAGDIFLPDGAYARTAQSVRRRVAGRQCPSLVLYAFDPRTRILPYADSVTHMVPAGARAIALALRDAGVGPVRLVQQQWTPNLDVRDAALDGRPIELLLVSAMQIHAAPAIEAILRAWDRGDDRPLILAGGPKAIYEPHAFFALGASRDREADAVVCGEEYVLLELLDRVLASTAAGETLRAGFERARREGLLEDVLGLVYREAGTSVSFPRLVVTGARRIVRNLDELPHPVDGYGLLEPPHRGRQLRPRPLEPAKAHRLSKWASLVITHGCKFRCAYCPIPGFNQHTWRTKSAERFADEVARMHAELGFTYFFGTDDNFFNDRATLEAYLDALSARQVRGRPLGDRVRLTVEATEHDVYVNRDLLPRARRAGLREIYFGIEDLSAELVRKGQSPERTQEIFPQMTALGIAPMVMVMHFEDQPLRSSDPQRPLVGLLDQADFVQAAGAVTYQCTIIAPAVGSKMFPEAMASGEVFASVGGKPVPDHCYDGNHVVAAKTDEPWTIQQNVLTAYRRFYGVRSLLRSLLRRDACRWQAVRKQFMGLWHLRGTAREYRRWMDALRAGRIKRWRGIPSLLYGLRVIDPVGMGGLVELFVQARRRDGLEPEPAPPLADHAQPTP